MNTNRRDDRARRPTAIAFAALLVVAGFVNRLVFGWRAAVALPLFGLFFVGLGFHYYDGYRRLRASLRERTRARNDEPVGPSPYSA
jgi:hypothetical protein